MRRHPCNQLTIALILNTECSMSAWQLTSEEYERLRQSALDGVKPKRKRHVKTDKERADDLVRFLICEFGGREVPVGRGLNG